MLLDRQYLVIVSVIFHILRRMFVAAMGMGPFDYAITGVEECQDIGDGKIKFDIKQYWSVRKSISIDINATLKVDLDDNISIDAKFSEYSNGRWKENSFVKVFPKGCTTIIGNEGIRKALAEADVSESKIKCPVKKGCYSVKGLLMHFELGIPVFVYNKYKGEVRLKLEDRTIGCVLLYGDVFPKKKKKSRG